MHFDRFSRLNTRARNYAVKSLQVSVLALLSVALTTPAWASGREIQSRTAPVYPELAKRMKITGAVKVECTVEADGRVKDAKAVSGNHIFAPSAEDAVRRWKFEPQAGETTESVQVNFTIAN